MEVKEECAFSKFQKPIIISYNILYRYNFIQIGIYKITPVYTPHQHKIFLDPLLPWTRWYVYICIGTIYMYIVLEYDEKI